jgi:hypothetical protein
VALVNEHGGVDPRDGVSRGKIPQDNKKKVAHKYGGYVSLRKKVKGVMRSVQAPFEEFDHYYPLNQVIDTYMDIWYESDSYESSSSRSCCYPEEQIKLASRCFTSFNKTHAESQMDSKPQNNEVPLVHGESQSLCQKLFGKMFSQNPEQIRDYECSRQPE